MKVRLLLTLAAISCAVPALMAQDAMKAIRADQIVWQNDTTFKGLQYANLLGDPAKAELIVSVVKLPPNFKIPLHTQLVGSPYYSERIFRECQYRYGERGDVTGGIGFSNACQSRSSDLHNRPGDGLPVFLYRAVRDDLR